jgi:hypothetical protein
MSPLPSKQFARRLQEIFRNVHFFSICPRFCWAPLSIADDLPIARPYAVAPKTGLAPGMDARCLMKKGTVHNRIFASVHPLAIVVPVPFFIRPDVRCLSRFFEVTPFINTIQPSRA